MTTKKKTDPMDLLKPPLTLYVYNDEYLSNVDTIQQLVDDGESVSDADLNHTYIADNSLENIVDGLDTSIPVYEYRLVRVGKVKSSLVWSK